MDREQVKQIIERLGGTTTTSEAIAAGMHWKDLYELRNRGELQELSRGVYRLADAKATSYLDYLAVVKRVPEAVICLTSALAYFDLTDEIPTKVHLAVQRGKWRPQISHPPIQVHSFAIRTFTLGRELVPLDSGDRIPMYSAERTIVDMFRLRRALGEDLVLQALKSYLRRQGAKPGELLEYSRKLRCKKVVTDSLKVLMS